LAVPRYLPDRHAQLADTAACAHTGQIEQLFQLGIVAAQSEFDFLHVTAWFGCVPMAQAYRRL
jgi:hypothetical protein